MHLNRIDLFTFVAFITVVVVVSLRAGRNQKTGKDYFLAGRGLPWWLIGFSLVASNISTEHFVGMAGRGYDLGMAIASYEWMAAITLVIVALFFLPRFLRAGIYTIPEFLEVRFGPTSRSLMSIYMMLAYVFVALATVLYSGALALQAVFELDITLGIWLIGILAGIYTVYGGLRAVVWSDLIQGIALLLGGILVTGLAFNRVGGLEGFLAISGDKLHTVLPADHPEMPWVAVFIGGLWIPNIYYWGLNQFITQRTLAANSLRDGQKGILLAAAIKLFIPFIIVFPGIMAASLFPDQIANADQAYPILIRELLPVGLVGVLFAALFGAVMSTLDSLLNSAATIFTMDIYTRHMNREASSTQQIKVGRWITAALVLGGCLWAPMVASAENIFTYIQMFWGFISPGIVAVFVFGILWKKVPESAAVGSLLLGFPVYGLLLYKLPEVAFLHHMAITFLIIGVMITIVTVLFGKEKALVIAETPEIDLTSSQSVYWMGGAIVLATLSLYIIFW